MSFEKNLIKSIDFSKSEEVAYQLCQLKYQSYQFQLCWTDALYHLKKCEEICSLLKELKKKSSK